MAIVAMWRIVIHHISGPDVYRKSLRYEDERQARSVFLALRQTWVPNPNDYHYELIDPDQKVRDQFDARKENA